MLTSICKDSKKLINQTHAKIQQSQNLKVREII